MLSHIKQFVLLVCILPLQLQAMAELPDPTRPANFVIDSPEPIVFVEEEIETKEKINWRVSAIRISERGKSAIVNNKLVREGEEIGPGKVIEIKPLSVVIEHEDRKLIVRLFKNQIKKEYKSNK